MTRDVATGVSKFWEFADLMRPLAPIDWAPRSIDFEHRVGTLRGGGSLWEASYSMGVSRVAPGQVEARVFISPEESSDIREMSARKRLHLFR